MTALRIAPSDLPPATALLFGDLVSYQPGAVVSRTITKGPAGTITAFAFDRDQGLSEHSAPYDAYVMVTDGKLKLTIGGDVVEASSGEIVLMPATVPHALVALGSPAKMLLVMLKQGAA
ncbi:MAG: cupin domain-containing protein [Myxococcota bacterium]